MCNSWQEGCCNAPFRFSHKYGNCGEILYSLPTRKQNSSPRHSTLYRFLPFALCATNSVITVKSLLRFILLNSAIKPLTPFRKVASTKIFTWNVRLALLFSICTVNSVTRLKGSFHTCALFIFRACCLVSWSAVPSWVGIAERVDLKGAVRVVRLTLSVI